MDNMSIFTARQQKNNYEKCGVCKYYIRQECQRHAPIVGEESYNIYFPHVKEDDYCGDFEHKLSVEVLRTELEECKAKYSELIMSVTKSTMEFPDESGHAIILRYIKAMESSN